MHPASSRAATAALTRREQWRYVARRAWHGFIRHRGIDSAATLAFFSALTVFPASLTIVSALSLGQGKDEATDFVLDLVDSVARPETVDVVKDPLTQLLSIGSPVVALLLGIVLSVWSMSSYATAFGRAANSVFEVEEGRRMVKFRALMIVLSLFLLVAFAAVAVLLLTTRDAAEVFAHALGLGEPWVSVWVLGRWPALLVVLTLIVAVLFYWTPNVQRERRRTVGVGALFAIIVWGAATAAFALYVPTVSNYDRIYGWLGGALALLVWMYISNLALVIGLEVDAEFTRMRQLLGGVDAETGVKLPLRDTSRNLILARRRAQDEAEGKAIREAAERERGGTAEPRGESPGEKT